MAPQQLIGFAIGVLSCSVALMGCGDQCPEKVGGVEAGANTCAGKKKSLEDLLALESECPDQVGEKKGAAQAARDSACCGEMTSFVADTMGWDLPVGQKHFEKFCEGEGKDIDTCSTTATPPCFNSPYCHACFGLRYMYTNTIITNSKWTQCTQIQSATSASATQQVHDKFDVAWSEENGAVEGGACSAEEVGKSWTSQGMFAA